MYQGGFLVFAVVATVVVVDAAYVGLAGVDGAGRPAAALDRRHLLRHLPLALADPPVGQPAALRPAVRGHRPAPGGADGRDRMAVVPPGRAAGSAVARVVAIAAAASRGGPARRGSRSVLPWPRSRWPPWCYGWTQRIVVSPDGRLQRALRGEPAKVATEPSAISLPDGYGPDHPLTVTVVGDSTGFTLADPTLLRRRGPAQRRRARLRRHDRRVLLRRLPPQPAAAVCRRSTTAGPTGAKAPTDAILIFLGGWEVFDPKVDGQRLSVTSDAWHDWFVRRAATRVEAMQAAAPRPVPIGLVELPCPTTDPMRVGLGAWERGEPARVDGRQRCRARRRPGDGPAGADGVLRRRRVRRRRRASSRSTRTATIPGPTASTPTVRPGCGSGSPSSTSSHPT